MANIASMLKQEIARLVRKELKSETDGLRKTNSRYRAEIAELKRRTAVLEQQIKALERQERRQAPAPIPKSTQEIPVRFRADGLKKHRQRLGLSAPALASILEISPQTIYNWEAGTSKPGKDQLIKIAILRKMGKRDVHHRLAQMRAA